MAQPYVGEIRMFGGNFAPRDWAFCEGQLLPIDQFDALFALIGTTYGGDGQTTFQLPDLRGRIPVHQGTHNGSGTTFTLGERAGNENVTLTIQQIPIHTHPVAVSASPGHVADPSNALVAADRDFASFSGSIPSQPMASGSVAPAGGSQPHENMPPFLCVSFIISLFGIFPSQN